MIDANFAARVKADADAFRDLSTDCAKVADACGRCRNTLRKMGAGSDDIDKFLDPVEVLARQLADRLHRLAQQPLPLPLQTLLATEAIGR